MKSRIPLSSARAVDIHLVAILSKYLGAPNRYLTKHTAWSSPIIEDWATRPRFRLDPANEWLRISRRLLEGAVEWARAERLACYIGQPDLNGPTEILAGLRGAQRLALDIYDNPGEIAPALEEINRAWLEAWRELRGICHRLGGWFFWMRLWSELPAVDLQSDVSCLLSKAQFDEHFLPFIEQQTRWAERTIYHLDGPGAVRHLDSLLALPRLSAIQWVPGAGAPPATHWIELGRRIQAGGKRLTLSCEPDEVETLLRELSPEGLMLVTECANEDAARDLLARVPGWTRRRR
jgi:GNAT superfamily N-acetyltransferase